MARVLDKKKLNKLVERMVVAVSALAIVYFLYLFTRDNYVNRTYLESIRTCGTDQEWCYEIWHGYLNDFRNAQLWSGVIGFGSPIVFFGGRALLNYLAPETKK